MKMTRAEIDFEAKARECNHYDLSYNSNSETCSDAFPINLHVRRFRGTQVF